MALSLCAVLNDVTLRQRLWLYGSEMRIGRQSALCEPIMLDSLICSLPSLSKIFTWLRERNIKSGITIHNDSDPLRKPCNPHATPSFFTPSFFNPTKLHHVNMSQVMSSRNLLRRLPDELVENLLSSMPDLDTLHNFITAYPQSRDQYQRCYKNILKTVLHRSKSLQISKMVCTVISIRNRPDLSDIEDFGKYFDSHLEHGDSPLLIDDVTDSLVALRDITLIAQDIEHFQKSFVDRRLREPCPTSSSAKGEDPPSQTELHRINRGFWRLQLVCEIFRAQSRSLGHDINYVGVPANDYVESLAHWELEEMECTYYHVREQYSLLKSDTRTTSAPDTGIPISCQPPIIQRLLINMGHDIESPTPEELEVNDQTPWQYGELYSAFLVARDDPWTRHIQTVWPDIQEANTPNEGWSCYSRLCRNIRYAFKPRGGFPRSGPIVCFHNWGYCIWDKNRLTRWNVLGRWANGFAINLRKWSDGNSGRGVCLHCEYELFIELLRAD